MTAGGVRPLLTAIAITLCLAACAAPQAQDNVPAVLVDPSAAVRAELLDAIRESLQGADVTLGSTAFVDASTVLVERNAVARQLDGRDRGRPESFRLQLRQGRCVLLHARDPEPRVLALARCKPE